MAQRSYQVSCRLVGSKVQSRTHTHTHTHTHTRWSHRPPTVVEEREVGQMSHRAVQLSALLLDPPSIQLCLQWCVKFSASGAKKKKLSWTWFFEWSSLRHGISSDLRFTGNVVVCLSVLAPEFTRPR
jgi:hypothetical protein